MWPCDSCSNLSAKILLSFIVHCFVAARSREQLSIIIIIYTGRGVELPGIIISEFCSAVSSPFLLLFCLVPFALYTLHAAQHRCVRGAAVEGNIYSVDILCVTQQCCAVLQWSGIRRYCVHDHSLFIPDTYTVNSVLCRYWKMFVRKIKNIIWYLRGGGVCARASNETPQNYVRFYNHGEGFHI